MYVLIKLIESHIQVELVRYYFCTNVKRCNSPKLLYWIHFWNIYWNTPKYTWQSCLHTICCINVHCFIKCAFVFVSLTFPSSYSLSLSLFLLSFFLDALVPSINYLQATSHKGTDAKDSGRVVCKEELSRLGSHTNNEQNQLKVSCWERAHWIVFWQRWRNRRKRKGGSGWPKKSIVSRSWVLLIVCASWQAGSLLTTVYSDSG